MSGSFLEDKAFLRRHKALNSTSAKFAAQNPDLIKYAKSSSRKTTWAIILKTQIHLLEALGAPAFTLKRGG